jgi:diadenylate cyclase
MATLRWQSVVDLLVLAIAIYLLLRWSREARALRLALSILALRVGALLARQLDLVITSWVIDAATVVAVLALVVLFQPELRRALMRLDITGRAAHPEQATALSALSMAAWSLGQIRCGALIVVARKDSLAALVTPGVALNGRASVDILMAVFQKGSPVHDGAAIVEGDLITRVGAILPLTQRAGIPGPYGTRHRAAMGLAERSDALIIVVSEERGDVTLMWESEARLMNSADELLTTVRTLAGRRPARRALSFGRPRRRELGLVAAAVALAALVWSLTFLFPGRSIRVRTVPIEFINVPPGLTIAAQSIDTETVEVWLRGNQFLLDTINLDTLVARCDLGKAHEGMNTLPLDPGAVEAPLGIKVEAMAPRQVHVQLRSPSQARLNH